MIINLSVRRGIINNFGVYQTYYGISLASEATASDISWIGSLQGALLFSVGIITGPLFDQGYLRSLLLVGSFFVVFGMMMTSKCEHFWQTMLAQGLTVGVGCGCLFVISVAIIPTYFAKRKAFAMGIAATGSALGGIVYTIMFRQLQPTIGFGWATRITAFIVLATLSVPIVGMKLRVRPSSRRRLFDASAWKEAPYTLFNIGFFFGLMGIYVPFFYLQSYSIDLGIVDEDLGSYLLVILNGASVWGRIIPTFFADKTGCFNMLIPTCIFTAFLAYMWIDIRNGPGIVVFAILYGFFSGTFLGLAPTTTVMLSPNLSVVGVRVGMTLFVASIGLANGNPIAGAVLRYGWCSLQAWAASCVAISAVCITAARVAKVGWGLKRKF